ncbi:MAG: TetR/AcrR family transcriptional regulator [Pseudomonadota bacterium]
MHAFWTQGFSATSMQDIIDLTGANRATLYSTYGDKRAVFMAALRHYEGLMRAALYEAPLETLGPIEVLRDFLMTFVEAEGARGCFVTNTALEVAPHDEEVRKYIASVQTGVERRIVELIDLSKADGTTPAEIDSSEEAKAILAIAIGLSVLARTRPNRKFLKSIVDNAMGRLER